MKGKVKVHNIVAWLKCKAKLHSSSTWLIIILGGGLIVALIYFLIKTTNADNSQTATAIIVAAITGFVSVVTVTWSKSYENKQEYLRRQREEKIQIYEAVIGFVYDRILLSEMTAKEKPSGDEITEFWLTGAKRISLWGDDEVVKLFSEWKNIKDGDDILTFLLKFESLIFTMRKSLGFKNNGLAEGDLLSFFMTDFKEQNKK
ncbi:hypothetical protein [Desulfarculus baarsii]